jgi:hypothetical protein
VFVVVLIVAMGGEAAEEDSGGEGVGWEHAVPHISHSFTRVWLMKVQT